MSGIHPLTNSALTASILESIFEITETGPKTKAGVSDQSIEVGQLLHHRQNLGVALLRRERLALRRWSLYPQGLNKAFYGKRVGAGVRGVMAR